VYVLFSASQCATLTLNLPGVVLSDFNIGYFYNLFIIFIRYVAYYGYHSTVSVRDIFDEDGV